MPVKRVHSVVGLYDRQILSYGNPPYSNLGKLGNFYSWGKRQRTKVRVSLCLCSTCGQKTYWLKKNFQCSQKCLVKNIFGLHNFFGQTKFLIKKTGLKYMRGQKFSGSGYFPSQKLFINSPFTMFECEVLCFSFP